MEDLSAHEAKESIKEELQEETIKKGNKAKRMLYKETGKKCGLGKDASAYNRMLKATAKRSPKKTFLNKEVSKALVIPGGLAATGLVAAAQ